MLYSAAPIPKNKEDLDHLVSLLSATLESTTDGILVVDRDGCITIYNQVFAKLWKIPESLLVTRDDRKTIEHVVDQLLYPEEFIKKIDELYANPNQTSFATIEFKDRRVVERYSQPQRLGDEIVGTVWSFREVTRQKRNEDRSLLLCEVSKVLAETLDYHQTLHSVAQFAVPKIAEASSARWFIHGSQFRRVDRERHLR
jgi:transcriptional regulator with PAS, ATPase and Fis domain